MSNHSDFRRAVLTEFPQLQGSIDNDDGREYSEMGSFAVFTQEAKGAAGWETYGRPVRLAARFLPSADEQLMNELYVSYLEHLDFEGPQGLTAWRLLPIELQRAWHDIIDYDEKLIGKPWVKTRPKISE